MSEIDKLVRKYNNRLEANGFQAVRAERSGWWFKWCQQYEQQHERDAALLDGPPRPKGERWMNPEGGVWLADGAGMLHYTQTGDAVEQTSANDFRWWGNAVKEKTEATDSTQSTEANRRH